MNTHIFEQLGWRVVSAQPQDKTIDLVRKVLLDELENGIVLRNSRHSCCIKFEFKDKTLLLKVPTSRNKRRWERVLTIWRGSESQRIFISMLQIKKLGLIGPNPIFFAEQYMGPMVVKSLVVYEYLEGRPIEPEDAPAVAASLTKLHNQGWLRNDAQPANFLMTQDNEVAWIDFKLSRPLVFRSLRTTMEMCQLMSHQSMAKGSIDLQPFSTPWSWLGYRFYAMSQFLRHFRRTIKARLTF